MKKVFFILLLSSASTFAARAQAPATTTPQEGHAALTDKKAPRFKFLDGEVHDFGKLPEGPEAEHIFRFKNTGKQPLIINYATSSCGCTVPTWPKEPIKPGHTGELKVTFHTADKAGQPFDKIIYITSNAASAKDRYELHIKGSVAERVFDPTGGQ